MFIILHIFLLITGKKVYEQLTVRRVGCCLFSVLWYDFMNMKTCPLFFNNHKSLSFLKLILNEDLPLWTLSSKYVLDYDPSNILAGLNALS